jgi:hypothetical protein
MRIPFLLLPSLFLFAACGNNSASVSTDSIPKADSTIAGNHPLNNVVTAPKNFNPEEFKMLADSVLSAMTGNAADLHYETETLTTQSAGLHNKRLGIGNKNIAGTRFFFSLPGKNTEEASFHVIHVVYSDSTDAQQAYLALKNVSGHDTKSNDVPGLTYGNDAVICGGNQLVWLCTSCTYSYKDHTKLKEMLRRSINASADAKTIDCKCGGAECETN